LKSTLARKVDEHSGTRHKGNLGAARRVIIGTRGSPLALAQTEIVLSELRRKNKDSKFEFVVEKIKTAGDEIHRKNESNGKRSNLSYTGKDSFTGALDSALIEGTIDIAVHSLKDVPVEGFRTKEIEILAFPRRDSPHDVLIPKREGENLATLPQGARVGTSSIRRSIQLKALRADLEIVELHGNVGTRIEKLHSSNPALDAIVLAKAGLKRLGLVRSIQGARTLPTKVMLPAVGQGCLAVAVRRNHKKEDAEIRRLVTRIDDRDTRLSVLAERSFSRELGGGCNLPLAAFGRISKTPPHRLVLDGMVAGEGNENMITRSRIIGPAERAESLGVKLARRLKGNNVKGGR